MPTKPKAKKQTETTAEKNKGGRPSDYTEELAHEICAQLATGKSMRAICEPDTMPDRGTVMRWVVEDREGFAAIYARAREAGGHVRADDMQDLNEKVLSGDLEPNAARVVLGNMQWQAERYAAKVFSPKSTVDVNMNDMDRDDKELLHELRQSAERLGVPVDGLLKGMKIAE